MRRRRVTAATCLVLAIVRLTLSVSAAASLPQGELLATEGTVQFTGPRTNWVPAEIGLKLVVQDRLRTLDLSRATLRLAELGRLRLNELTTLEILPPKATSNKATIDLKAGALYFFTRDKPREFLLQTPYAIGASRGTEFLTMVDPSGHTVLTVFDGEVELTNSLGSIVLTNGEQGTVQPGQAPVKTAVLQATNIVQWWLYYPGVLDTDELSLSAGERTALASSISAYRRGDLRGALEAYPAGRLPQTNAERAYYAGLLLSVGQVDKAEAALAAFPNQPSIARALQEVIAVVESRAVPLGPTPTTATEWLARSYVEQTTNLAAALSCARAAVEKSPSFGFAWERVAELEFSFGHADRANDALNKALELSPRNAQALVLRGFISAAGNHFSDARESFEQGIRADPALGNAWLGRGLCRIHGGDPEGGRADLETAAAVEPNRSLLHSYLGKAFANLYDERHAGKELGLASRLDPNDPTPWLYSALLKEQENRLNEGVEDLEKSQELNDNRRVYRSQLLLDQDRAVRSASLATIYQRDGMDQVAFREASTAVSADYANYSAHLFLANSLDALRDPTRFNLRYETAWANELFLANLLSPPGAGALSTEITQQEYSKLFEANRIGLVSDTSWRSDGQVHESASQFGSFGGSSYSLDVDYQHNDGIRTNNDLKDFDSTLTIKQQITPQDSILLQATVEDYHSGDNFQYYNPNLQLRPNFRYTEHEKPVLSVGYHREWTPGIHTLFLGGWLTADQEFSDSPAYPPFLANILGTNVLTVWPFHVQYSNDFQIYSAELNQIFQTERQILIVGARYQNGEFHGTDYLVPTNPASIPNFAPPNHEIREPFERIVGYGYYTVELPTHLLLTGGLAYDTITYPSDYRDVPLVPGESTRSELEPKAAIIWSPVQEVTVRGAYARSLGGVSFDQSFRLEPVQLAGFSQTFRQIIPESVAGAISAPEFEIRGAALDLKFKTGTYLSVQGELLDSDVDRTIGMYKSAPSGPRPVVSTLQHMDYKEQSLLVTFNQLVGNQWSFGADYRFTRAELKQTFPELPPPSFLSPFLNLNVRADLQEVTPYVLFNHRSGFFARAEAAWYSQSNFGYTPALPGDDFYQVNLYAGYRFPHQYGDFTLGLLNVTGTDYHLNPLNYYAELPRERVWSLRLRLNF